MALDAEEALAAIPRPGNAGANTAQNQIDCLERALCQLPGAVRERAELLVRADCGGLCHELLDYLDDERIRFSVG